MVGVVLVNYHTNKEVVSIANLYCAMSIIDKVVVVNNEANCESIEALKALSNEKIVIFHESKNLGYSKGNNVGCKYLVEKYNCDYIIISNSDVSITEMCIKNVLDKFNCNSNFAALAPVVLNDIGKQEPIVNYNLDFFYVTYRIFLPISLLYKVTNIRLSLVDDIAITNYLLGSWFICRGNILKKVNYFDENIFLYCEENILGKKFSDIGYVEGVVLSEKYYHLHPYRYESIKAKMLKLKRGLNSETYYFEKYLGINPIQKFYLKLVQGLYATTRYIWWLLKDFKEVYK